MREALLVITLLTMSAGVQAGELIRDGLITEIGNTYSNGKDFTIKVEGGIGLCNTWVLFPESKAGSTSNHEQAFQIALAAVTNNKKVRIHNFENSSCDGANFISLMR
jgi:hypothetical protein